MKVQATWSTNVNLDRTIERLVSSPLVSVDRTEKELFNGWLTLRSGRRAQFQISLKGKINIYSEVDDLEEAQSILKPHTVTLDGRAADWIVEKVHHI